ncbi:MAG: hypothetical protein OD918_06580 [Gammaproteobacteria bacterium]
MSGNVRTSGIGASRNVRAGGGSAGIGIGGIGITGATGALSGGLGFDHHAQHDRMRGLDGLLRLAFELRF